MELRVCALPVMHEIAAYRGERVRSQNRLDHQSAEAEHDLLSEPIHIEIHTHNGCLCLHEVKKVNQ